MNKHKAILKLQSLVNEFASYYSKLFEFNRKLSDCIFAIYKQSYEPYKSKFNDETLFHNYHELFDSFSSKYADVHLKTINIFNEFVPKLSELIKLSEDFTTYYNEMDGLKKDKEESFKSYNYYHNKLRKLQASNKTDKAKLLRNEEKYTKAHSDFIHKAYRAYDHLSHLDSNLYKRVNEVLIKVYTIESNLYNTIASSYNEYSNLSKDIEESESKVSF